MVAAFGKIAGGAAGARIAGYSWRDSMATGALLDARGQMEVIIMRAGLDSGLIEPELFTMLLIMALATTAMTGLITFWSNRAPLKARTDELSDRDQQRFLMAGGVASLK